MVNFLTYYKVTNPNVYSLLVSLLLAIWYNGISGLINYYWPVRGPALSLLFLIVPLVIFLSDDGKLEELYKAPNISYPINAAAISSQRQYSGAVGQKQHFEPVSQVKNDKKN